MGPPHRFFRKAVQPPPKVRKVKPNHKGKMLVLTLPSGKTLFMSSSRAASLAGASKAGKLNATRPNPGRWTPATARKASMKYWRTRGKMNHRIGVRLGVALHRRKKVSRPPLRVHYSLNPTAGISCEIQGNARCTAKWTLTEFGVTRTIRERAALVRLGHLPSTRKHDTIPTADNVAPLVRRPRGKKETE